jgi:hypothetical protein
VNISNLFLFITKNHIEKKKPKFKFYFQILESKKLNITKAINNIIQKKPLNREAFFLELDLKKINIITRWV